MSDHQVPRSVLITGASRGIGLGLVKQFLSRKGVEHVIATCRHPSNAKFLNELVDPRLSIIEMDVLCDKSIEQAVDKVSHIVGDLGLNLLINNAGILIGYHLSEPPSREKLEQTMSTNVVSPIIVTHYFLPLLRRAVNGSWGVSHSAIINMGSDFGSISACPIFGSTERGFMPQKVSKAAVAQFSKVLSQDLEKEHILVVNIHPGFVASDMGGEEAPTSVDESVSNMAATFERLTQKHHGGFFSNTGESLPY